MYAILNVIFGVAWETGTNAVLDDACAEELDGFAETYSGGGDGWSYFGIVRNGFDECQLTYLDEQDTWQPTKDLAIDYEAMVQAIEDDAVRAAVRALGNPRMVIVPSST